MVKSTASRASDTVFSSLFLRQILSVLLA